MNLDHGKPPPNCIYCQSPLDQHVVYLGRDWCNLPQCSRQGVARDQTQFTAGLVAQARAQHPEVQSSVTCVISGARSDITELPPERRTAFTDHLSSVVHRNFAHESSVAETAAATLNETAPLNKPASPSDTVSMSEKRSVGEVEVPAGIVQTVCALCRGTCCDNGGLEAFVDDPLIDRYRRNNPDATAESTIEDYTSHLPRLSQDLSCVFHGEHGCTLTREMRSDICNTYHCRGLQMFALDLERQNADDAVLVSIQRREVLGHRSWNRRRDTSEARPNPEGSS